MIGFELDVLYNLIYMIIGYSLLNLTLSLIANFRKKNTPGNNYIYMSILFRYNSIAISLLSSLVSSLVYQHSVILSRS